MADATSATIFVQPTMMPTTATLLNRVNEAEWLEPEWLDAGYGTWAEVAASFDDMWRINRYLGGWRSLAHHLYPRLNAWRGECTIVDLGAGAADIPVALARWAQARHRRVRIIAVDVAARHLRLARARTLRAPAVSLLRADANGLPLPPKSADFVISSLFLHHFSPSALMSLLSAAQRIARCGLIMSDLVRSRWPALAFKLLQPIFARSTLTRHDGALSIRRAYTPPELRAIAVAAGLPNVHIHTHVPWRMTLLSSETPEFAPP